MTYIRIYYSRHTSKQFHKTMTTKITPKPISDSTLLSPRSKELYTKCIEVIAAWMYKGDFDQLVRNPDAVYAYLRKKYKQAHATIGTFFTAINSMINHHPNYKLPPDLVKRWQHYRTTVRKQRIAEYDTNHLSARESMKVVATSEIHKRFCFLQQNPILTYDTQKHHMQYILFAMYLNIRPKRADLGDVYITTERTVPTNYAAKGNYIILTDKPRLVMNNYKTRNIYGTIIEPLNEDIVKILKESLSRFPRQHLFVQSKAPIPYTKSNSYAQFVKRTFDEHFGRAMGTSLWRRVYIAENVDFNKSSFAEIQANARLSGHSPATQLQIYKIVDLPKPLQVKTVEEKSKPIRCNAINVANVKKDKQKAYTMSRSKSVSL